MFDAVLATRPGSPLDFDARLRALVQFLQPAGCREPRGRQQAHRQHPAQGDRSRSASTSTTSLLIDPAEQVLAEQVAAMAREVEPKFAARDYTQRAAAARGAAQGRRRLLRLRHGQWRTTRRCARNRLALLKRMQGLFMRVADLSRLPG